MTNPVREPSAPAERAKRTPTSPIEPDPEWEEMEAMMDRIAREPMEFDKADVAVTAGHMNAAHAEGPITLHDGMDTQVPEARVIIGDAILPTKIVAREPLTVTGLPRQSGRTILLVAIGATAALLVGAVVAAVIYGRGEAAQPAADASSVPGIATSHANEHEELLPPKVPSLGPIRPATAAASSPVVPASEPTAPPATSIAVAGEPLTTGLPPTTVSKNPVRPSSSHRPPVPTQASTADIPTPSDVPPASQPKVQGPDWSPHRRF